MKLGTFQNFMRSPLRPQEIHIRHTKPNDPLTLFHRDLDRELTQVARCRSGRSSVPQRPDCHVLPIWRRRYAQDTQGCWRDRFIAQAGCFCPATAKNAKGREDKNSQEMDVISSTALHGLFAMTTTNSTHGRLTLIFAYIAFVSALICSKAQSFPFISTQKGPTWTWATWAGRCTSQVVADKS